MIPSGALVMLVVSRLYPVIAVLNIKTLGIFHLAIFQTLFPR